MRATTNAMTSEASHLSNAEIADRLAGLAQLLSTQKENPYKIKAYQRATAKIRTLSESVEELVHQDSELPVYSGIGEAISHDSISAGAACLSDACVYGEIRILMD